MKAISGKKMCKILEKKGWVLKRIKGSHYYYLGPAGPRPVIVPVHGNKDLKPGLQISLKDQWGR